MALYSVKELIVLLNNLSRTEKSKVRKDIKNTTATHLINFIWKDKEVTERKVNTKLKQKKNEENIDAEQLIHTIFESIAPIISTEDEVNKLLQKLVFCRFLFEKKLKRRALKHLKKIKKRAYQIEQFDISLQAIKIELTYIGFTPKQLVYKAKLIEEMEKVVSYLSNDVKAFQLAEKTENIFLKLGLSAAADKNSQLGSLQKDLDNFSNEKYLSLNAIQFSKNSLIDIYRFQGNYDSAIKCQVAIIEAFNINPVLKYSRLSQYIQALVNYTNRMLEAKKFKSINDLKGVEKLISDLKKSIQLDSISEEYLSSTIEFAKLSIYKDNWDIKNALKQIPKVEEHPLPLKLNGVLDSIYKYEFAVIHFYNGNYTEAITYIDNIKNDCRKIYPDLYLFSRIISLFSIAFSDTTNSSRFKSNHDSLRKAIAKAKHNTHLEKALLSLIYHYYQAHSKIKKNAILKKFKSKIPQLTKKASNSFMFFNFEKWIEDVIET